MRQECTQSVTIPMCVLPLFNDLKQCMTCKRKVLGIKCEFQFSRLFSVSFHQYWVRDAQERCVQVGQWMHHRALNSYTRCQCQFKYLYDIVCARNSWWSPAWLWGYLSDIQWHCVQSVHVILRTALSS